MIIVLKDADFSANNIGQITPYRVLDPYTVAAIAASGSTLTDEQKFALDDLFLAMGVDGSNQVMSKMRKLYIPMIAGEVGNALINYADNTFPKDATPNAANWELRNHGIAQKASGQNFTLELNNPLVGTNMTHIWLRTENMEVGTNDSGKTFVLRGQTDTSKFLGLVENSSSSNSYINWDGYGFNVVPATTYKNGEQRIASGYVVRGANDYNYKTYYENKSRTIVVSTDMSGETKQTLYVLGLANQGAPKPYGLMLLGEAISAAEFADVLAKVDALYDAFAG